MNHLTLPFRKLASAAALAAFGVFAPLTLPAASAQAPAPIAPTPAPGPLADAVAALRGISTLRADFIQTDRNGQRRNGVLTLKRPGHIRFQYAPGIPLLIVSDGRALTLIDYEVRQV